MKGKPTKGKAVDVERCLELYKSGMSINEVGRQLGHHHGVIRYHLNRNRVTIRGQKESQRKPILSEDIGKMYQKGMSAYDIGQVLGITYQCVYDRLAEIGIKTRNRKEQINAMISRGTYNIPKGENHKKWNGGRSDWNGYTMIRQPNKTYVPEHRVVWEQHNGPIPKGWVVHHLNGNKKDNRIENLVAMSRTIHSPLAVLIPYIERIQQLERELYDIDKEAKKRC